MNKVKKNPKEKKVVEKKPRKNTNYLNNKDMLAELIKSKKQGKMTNELSKMILLLTEKYSQHPWFINYSYRDDMCSFAHLTIVKMWNNFNPDKGSNAFAYFTQIIKRAFYQFNIQEKKQRNIRDMLLIQNGESPSYTFLSEYDSDNYHFEKMDNFEQEEFKLFDQQFPSVENDNPLNNENSTEVSDVSIKDENITNEIISDEHSDI